MSSAPDLLPNRPQSQDLASPAPRRAASETPPYHPRTVLSPGSDTWSPSVRHPLTRPLSPDLPTRDALYLFCNFASYMRSPHEGAEGVEAVDFRDTMKLLDYARVRITPHHPRTRSRSSRYRHRRIRVSMCCTSNIGSLSLRTPAPCSTQK